MEPRQEVAPGRGELPQSPVPGIESPFGAGPETKTGVSLEQQPASQTVGAAQEAVQAAMPVLPAPVTTAPLTDDSTTDDATLPIVANDDDLIEKEWVDK